MPRYRITFERTISQRAICFIDADNSQAAGEAAEEMRFENDDHLQWKSGWGDEESDYRVDGPEILEEEEAQKERAKAYYASLTQKGK